VYEKLNEMEIQAKEDKQASQHERALQEYFVRTTPIGFDRFRNSYWSFTGDDRLFVQLREPLQASDLAHCPMPPPVGADGTSDDADVVLNKLYESRPNRYRMLLYSC
jgi:hypothetical protein